MVPPPTELVSSLAPEESASRTSRATADWRLVAEDAPSELRCRDIAAFMLRMTESPNFRAKEKDRIISWKLRENEAHPGFASTMVTQGDRIVSLCTVTPKRLWYRGSEQPWAEIGDTFTDPEFQRCGMFVAVTDASRSRAQAAGFSIVYGLPNEASLPPYTKKLNFAIKADIELQEHILLLSSRGLTKQLATRGYRRSAAASGHLTSAILSRMAVGVALTSFDRSDATVREERIFTAEYDDLWSRVRSELICAQVRDARYLEWRYRANPFPFKLLAARRAGQLVGYAVVLAAPAQDDSSMRRMYLMDWLFAPGNSEQVGSALFKAVVETCVNEGADLLVGYSPLRSPLPLPWPRFLTVQRQFGKPLIIHRNGVAEGLISDKGGWHFTLSDTDAF